MHEKLKVNGYKSSTGLLSFKGCPLRLREISVQRNRGPTTLTGGQISNSNAIRRRVAKISYNKYRNEKAKVSYGPLFGLKKSPSLGGDGPLCNDKALFSSNGGSGNEVVFWKRIFGGNPHLFDTNSCSYGCCDDKIFAKDDNCVCFEIDITTDDYIPKRGDSLIPQDSVTAGGNPNDNVIETVTPNTSNTVQVGTSSVANSFRVKIKTRKHGVVYKLLSSITSLTTMVVTAEDLLNRNRWGPVGTIVVQPADENTPYESSDC